MTSTTPTHGHFVLSRVSLATGYQDGGPSNIYDITEESGDCEQSKVWENVQT